MWPRPGGFFTSANPSATPQLGGVPGFRDLLPLEAEILREAQESLLGEMRRWGYRHVIAPPVERMAVLDVGLGSAARCMEAPGIRRYQIDVGHAEFFQGIMDAVKLPDDVKAAVRSALAARDFVALESLLEDTPLKSAEHELLLRFPALRGGAEI